MQGKEPWYKVQPEGGDGACGQERVGRKEGGFSPGPGTGVHC